MKNNRCPFCGKKLIHDSDTVLGAVYSCPNPNCTYHLIIGSAKKIAELFKENEK